MIDNDYQEEALKFIDLLRNTGYSDEYDHYIDMYDMIYLDDDKITKVIDFI